MGDWHIQHTCMPQALCAFSPFLLQKEEKRFYNYKNVYYCSVEDQNMLYYCKCRESLCLQYITLCWSFFFLIRKKERTWQTIQREN